LPVYSPEPRVWITEHKGPWASITVQIHKLSEIDTPAFRAFLTKAATSFHATVGKMSQSPEDLMPWKRMGEKWHLGDKGFPPGRKLRWDREALPRLLELLRKVEPELAVQWDQRAHITVRVPGISRGWVIIKTKESDCLEARFLGKRGQFNLARLEGLGAEADLDDKQSGTTLTIRFTQPPSGGAATKLRTLLAEHLRGFHETFGDATDAGDEDALAGH
jgi:excinuclease ABC subunit A